MIDYVAIRDADFQIIGLVDTAKSVIWHKVYYGVGDFEIYAQATQIHVNLLQKGNYISRLDDDEVGVIERVEIRRNLQDGLMIIASGRFAKSILERRIIYTLSGKMNKATILQGNVESAARALVANNATACTWNTARNIPGLVLGAHSGSTQIIRDNHGNPAKKQVTNDNLLIYSDALLQEYTLSAKITLDESEEHLEYKCFQGVDRSMNNDDGNDSIIFSGEFDNLIDSDFVTDDSAVKTAALIGGEGEGLDRFYSALEGDAVGLNRRELFINAVNISQKYEDDQGEEQSYSDEEYKEMLDSRGKLELAKMIQVDTFSGTINTSSGNWLLNRDYSLGDIVTIQDNQIGVYANVRIIETTEVQDDNGYSVSLVYE